MTGRRGKLAKPPLGEPWIWRTRELLSSAAWRSLGINGRRVIDFLEIEHMNHAGTENGRLKATYRQLVDHGIHPRHVSKAIKEVERTGLVQAQRAGQRSVTTYTLTWLPTDELTPPSNKWRLFAKQSASTHGKQTDGVPNHESASTHGKQSASTHGKQQRERLVELRKRKSQKSAVSQGSKEPAPPTDLRPPMVGPSISRRESPPADHSTFSDNSSPPHQNGAASADRNILAPRVGLTTSGRLDTAAAKDRMFAAGVLLLMKHGVDRRAARAMLGQWQNATDTVQVLAAIEAAAGADNPAAFITSHLRLD